MSTVPRPYELTQHARKVLEERGIEPAWVARTLADPEWILPDPKDAMVERYCRHIPEFGDRVLRGAVNTALAP